MNTLKNTFLETERLILKVIDESYVEKVVDYWNKNKQFLNPWSPLVDDEFFTAYFQSSKLKDDIQRMKEGLMFKVWMIKKEDEKEEIIGSISLNNIVRGVFQSCHIGYQLSHNETNQGYMTEAVQRVIDYAFYDLKLHRIEANIMPINGASLKVVEKLGFESEGLAKKYLKINGKWEDHIHMVILNKEME
ncbi:GNAT family N-acetyltransferase [Chengkuizengella axinellae]|uniref:GNAT family N-acetyltransferase n=1 Tax=Chengkuizengella axinellae TaxID=3064388 RepID=A0ABT9J2Q3_9BACL|nr:GNAT family N-acetyltransferase [Chengkuizengella sp. 2205SS18-9]MDP5275773.1 GNAT family N-acetyltransferase [Chengkuizengella sp. 2205SS18-9]